MKKKLLSLLLVATLVFTLTPVAFATEVGELSGEESVGEVSIESESVAEEADTLEEEDLTLSVWTGEATTPTLSDGVYQINSAEDLAGFAALVNAGNSSISAVLNVNVDLNENAFTPIGAKAYKNGSNGVNFDKAFGGEFDGGGHTIKNGSIASASDIYNMGLFGFVVGGGVVKNLILDDITVTNTQSENEAAAGVVVGAIYKGTIQNVTVGENCAVTGINRVGGVVGSVRDKCTITNCTNYGEVTGSGMYTGGVIGASHDMDYTIFRVTGAPATITYCYNYGTVSGNSEVGGIVGYSDQATITNCHNTGNVSATGNYGTGGIVGFDAYNPRTLYRPSKGSTIAGCTNIGNISGGRAAGIVGTLGVTPGRAQPTSNKTLTVITTCSNSGAITGTAGKCGSIFGYQITYANGDGDSYINHLYVKITGCTIGGTVNGEGVALPTSSVYYTTN